MTNPIRLVDRSRSVEDWKCPRKRYLTYEWEGRGLTSDDLKLELFLGIILHDALAAIATSAYMKEPVLIDFIAETAKEAIVAGLSDPEAGMAEADYAREQGALMEGLIRGYHKHVWPRLLAQYPNIIAVEKEMEYAITPDLIFMCKPDLVLADAEGNHIYIEYKSTSNNTAEWIASWSTQVQLHSTLRAIEHTLGVTPVGVQIVGFYKGYVSYNKQNSPFCYAFMKAGNPPFTRNEIAYEYRAGFKRTATWEMEGGVRKWVDGMPSNVLASQFPMTPLIGCKDYLIDSFFRQRMFREREIAMALDMLPALDEAGQKEVIDLTFPQRFDQCQPPYRNAKPCEFKRMCHGNVADPLTHGYTLRVSHHQRETDQQNEAPDAE